MVSLQPFQPQAVLWTFPGLCRLLDQGQVVERVRLSGRLHFLTLCEHLLPIFAGDLQHANARLLSLPLRLREQALIDEGGNPIEVTRSPSVVIFSRRTTDG